MSKPRISPRPPAPSFASRVFLFLALALALAALSANGAAAQLLPGDVVLLQEDRIVAVQPTGGPVRTISSADVGSIDQVIFDSRGRRILFPDFSSFTIAPEGVLYATGAGILWKIDGRTGNRVAVSTAGSPGMVGSFGADFAVEIAGDGRLVVASFTETNATSLPIDIRLIEVDPVTGFKTLLQVFRSPVPRGVIQDFNRLSDGRVLASTTLFGSTAFIYDPDFPTTFIRPLGLFDNVIDITANPSDPNSVYARTSDLGFVRKSHLILSGTVPISFPGLSSIAAIASSDQGVLFGLAGTPRQIYTLDPDTMTASSPIDVGAPTSRSIIKMRVAPSRFEGGEDRDGDGVSDAFDNCPLISNEDQADADNDLVGDVCNDDDDADGDEFRNELDNCPADANPEQEDLDGDGVGDACNSAIDADGDEIADSLDICPDDFDPLQSDTDGDGLGDACDPYPGAVDHELASLREQVETLSNELAECRSDPPVPSDFDRDGIRDAIDECPDTLLGEPVGFAGCSLDQFCERFGPVSGSSRSRKACADADWLGIAPPGKATYCRPRGVRCIPRYDPASR